MTPGIGALDLEASAAAVGTPFFVYDADWVIARLDGLRAATGLSRERLALLYAVKANPNPALLAALEPFVDGLDVASEGELALALGAGYAPARLSFAGPGKREAALALAVAHGIGALSAESIRELELVAALARGAGAPMQVVLRVNPAAAIQAFPVKMSGVPSPFGIDEEELPRAVAMVRASPWLELFGLHVYWGTQCHSARALARSFAATLDLAEQVEALAGQHLGFVNLGGGFGVGGGLDGALVGAGLGRMLEKFAAGPGRAELRFALELGRWLVAEAGLYVARVLRVKESRGRRFVILDGGTHHLQARFRGEVGRVVNLSRPDAPGWRATVVGPLCTPLDVLVEEGEVPELRPGELAGFTFAGAYGLSASPAAFLGHPPPAELILRAGRIEPARGLQRASG